MKSVGTEDKDSVYVVAKNAGNVNYESINSNMAGDTYEKDIGFYFKHTPKNDNFLKPFVKLLPRATKRKFF